MRPLNAIALVLAAACVVTSCVKPSQNAPKHEDQLVNVDAYNIARDSKQYLNARREAASHLTQGQKKQLQTELFKEIPGDLSAKTLDAIWLLASVGDMAAAEKLEQFEKDKRYDIPGKLNYAAS